LLIANSSETVEQLEATLTSWLKQIEQVLTESEQIRREADNVGPSAELVYWRCRMTTFNSWVSLLLSLPWPTVQPYPGREITQQEHTFQSQSGGTNTVRTSAMLVLSRKYTYKVKHTYTCIWFTRCVCTPSS